MSSSLYQNSNTESIKKSLVSIVIVNYNSGEMLELCLKSIVDSGYDEKEIIIVDNGSIDDSLRKAIDFCKDKLNFRVVKLFSNHGFAKGNNIGIGCSKGEYIILLNNDTRVEKKWIDYLVETMNSDPRIAIAQSKLMQPDKQRFDSTGDFIDSFGNTFRRGYGEVDKGQYNQVEEVFSARGAALIIRTSLLPKIGLLDESLLTSYEDIDLCWRARVLGYKVIYVPKSIVYHIGGATIKTFNNARVVFDQTKNLLRVFIKNQNSWQLVRRSPLALIIGCMGADLFKRRITHLLERLKAIFSVLFDFKKIYSYRMQENNYVYPLVLESDIPILASFFINSVFFGEKKALKIYTNSLMDKKEPSCFSYDKLT